MEEKEKLDKLRKEIGKAQLEKKQIERQITRTKNQMKYRENLKRKARTHRLIVLGAVMEQYFPELKELSEVQLGQLMKKLDINAIRSEFHKAETDERRESEN